MNAKKEDRPVWMITGCSTGFGRELAKYTMASGYRTVATAVLPGMRKRREGATGVLDS
jgi:NADP-dependent 3-hydroxy acid dehydrogenase YdfG